MERLRKEVNASGTTPLEEAPDCCGGFLGHLHASVSLLSHSIYRMDPSIIAARHEYIPTFLNMVLADQANWALPTVRAVLGLDALEKRKRKMYMQGRTERIRDERVLEQVFYEHHRCMREHNKETRRTKSRDNSPGVAILPGIKEETEEDLLGEKEKEEKTMLLLEEEEKEEEEEDEVLPPRPGAVAMAVVAQKAQEVFTRPLSPETWADWVWDVVYGA